MIDFLDSGQVVAGLARQLAPVLILIGAGLAASLAWRRRLGLYGRLFYSPVAVTGLAIVAFWVLAALLAPWIAPFDPYAQIRPLQHALPGAIDPETGRAYLMGGDALGRCVFSRLIHGSRTVMAIAPAATLAAYMIGILLGLPAGYYGGWLDTALSFIANLVLAFPVILLFYLLVTPQIRETALPQTMAAVLFAFPLLLLIALVVSRLAGDGPRLALALIPTLVIGGWAYLAVVGLWDPTGLIAMDANMLNVFIAVTFVTAPTVFRIVRGLTLDIRTRDYIAAAQTRGEHPAYIMLWEILPNARGPLIVDACLRIGYTTILLGTLGFFGLGVAPESPDWGSTINEARRLLRLFVHPALPPALAIMSLVLGLNLLADGIREQALRD